MMHDDMNEDMDGNIHVELFIISCEVVTVVSSNIELTRYVIGL